MSQQGEEGFASSEVADLNSQSGNPTRCRRWAAFGSPSKCCAELSGGPFRLCHFSVSAKDDNATPQGLLRQPGIVLLFFWDKLSAKGHSKSAFFCTVVAVQSRSVSRSQGLYPHLGKSSSVPVSLCSLSALYPSSQEHHITYYALPEVFRQVKYGGIVDAVVLFRPRRDFGVAVVRAKT